MECGWVGERRGERGEVRGRLRREGGKEGERGRLAGDGGEGSLCVSFLRGFPLTRGRRFRHVMEIWRRCSSFSGAKVAT